MAEKESSIVKWGKSQGLSKAEAYAKLGDYHDQFQTLYVSGPFITWSDDDMASHKSFSSVFKNNPELFRAYNDYRQTVEGEDSVEDALESARNSYGVADIGRAIGDFFGGDFDDDSFKEILGGFGIQKIGEKLVLPYKTEQGLEGFEDNIAEKGDLSDQEIKDLEVQKSVEKANELAEQQGAQNVFNIDRDPRTAAIRQRVDGTKFDPFLQGTQGQRSIINDLLDKSSRKIPAPNLGDPRSVSKFNNSVSSREFVRNNALKKLRDLDDMADSRREIVNNHLGVMTEWEADNKGKHPMADKGVENWTDQQKINFVKNFNLGNSTSEKYEEYKEKTKDPLEKEYERKLKALQESRELPPQNPFNEETKKDAMFIAPRQADLLLAEDPNANTTATRPEKSIGQSILDAREDVLRSEAASRPPNTVDTSLRDAARAERENVFREKYANNPARVQREAREAQLRGLSSPRAERDSRYQLPAYSQQTLDAPAPAPAPASLSSATSNGFSLNTKDSSAPDPKEKAFADLEEAKQAEGLRSQIADVRGQIQNQQDILDLKDKADRELDARYATENAAKAARNAAYIEAQRMAKEKNVADTKNYYNQQVPVYGRRNDGTLGLTYDPNSYKAMKERSQVMGGLQKYGESDPFGSYMEEEKRRRKNQNIFG